MNKYITLEGVIVSDSEKRTDELFDLLESNGFEYTGIYDTHDDNRITSAVDFIVSTIDSKKLNKIHEIVSSHYQDDNIESTIEFLHCNTGTSIFSEVFNSVLEREALSEFRYYNESNWMISDTFEGLLGEKVASMFGNNQ